MAQEYDAEIGRAVGWDLASFGWTPRDDAPAHVLEGHAEGKARFGTNTKRLTRFERKWLQLRQNALRRGKVVDKAITPAFIEFIDYPTCPVDSSSRNAMFRTARWPAVRVATIATGQIRLKRACSVSIAQATAPAVQSHDRGQAVLRALDRRGITSR